MSIIIGQKQLYLPVEKDSKAQKCEECGAYYHHSPTCSKIDFDTCKELLLAYFDYFTKEEQRRIKDNNHYTEAFKRLKDDVTFWKGKFEIVKNENNKLRKRA